MLLEYLLQMKPIMKSLFLMEFLIWCNSEKGEDIVVTISSGAFFNDIPEAIIYDTSLPIIYTQNNEKTDITEEGIQNLEVKKYCENKDNNYCNIMDQTIILLDTINKHIKKNENDLFNDLTNTQPKNRISKRGIQFLGNLYHFCCNIATEKQLKHLYTNDEKIKIQIDKLKNIFVSDHDDLTRITTELNDYTNITKNKLNLLKNTLNLFVEEEKQNVLINQNRQENTIQGVQEIIYKLMTIILKISNHESKSSVHLHCKLGKIPPSIVEPEILEKDLKKLSNVIDKDEFQLVIPIDNMSAYYNIPIVECQFSKTQTLIKIKIPIKEKTSVWKLYQYIPTHFKFHDSICIIFSEKTYLAVDIVKNEH